MDLKELSSKASSFSTTISACDKALRTSLCLIKLPLVMTATGRPSTDFTMAMASPRFVARVAHHAGKNRQSRKFLLLL